MPSPGATLLRGWSTSCSFCGCSRGGVWKPSPPVIMQSSSLSRTSLQAALPFPSWPGALHSRTPVVPSEFARMGISSSPGTRIGSASIPSKKARNDDRTSKLELYTRPELVRGLSWYAAGARMDFVYLGQWPAAPTHARQSAQMLVLLQGH
jgi:hypothetical protein